ncbi:MAG: tetratricopeptide repeat protein [Treponemataceae bacterium]|nr:tetratricopeptide repeat protein [Treponemataceae bacterium]
MERTDGKAGRKSVLGVFLCGTLALIVGGCAASGGMLVPGQQKIILQNLAVEYYTVAEAYAGVQNYAKAAEYYQRAMRDETLYLTAYYKLARSYALAKDWDNALPIYADLLSRDPENAELAASRAYILAMSGDTDEAFRQYQELIAKNPNDQSFLENYVALLVDSGRGELAEAHEVSTTDVLPVKLA